MKFLELYIFLKSFSYLPIWHRNSYSNRCPGSKIPCQNIWHTYLLIYSFASSASTSEKKFHLGRFFFCRMLNFEYFFLAKVKKISLIRFKSSLWVWTGPGILITIRINIWSNVPINVLDDWVSRVGLGQVDQLEKLEILFQCFKNARITPFDNRIRKSNGI